MILYPTCPECGRTAEKAGDWVKPGFTGFLITGLDFENCPGCWDTMARNGAATGILSPDGTWNTVPRPEPAV
jgi:hypothetical protein